MVRCRYILGLVCCVLLLLPAGKGLQAEMGPEAFSLSPAVGGYVFEGDQDIDHGPAFGLRLGASWSKHWDQELSFFFIDTESDDGGGDIEGYLYRLEGIYTFLPESRLSPFTAAGIGGLTLDPDRGGSDTDFLVNYGGGLKLDLTRSLALRGDVRHVLPFDDLQHNLLYSVGLTYAFGGPEPVQAAAPADSDGDGVPDSSDRCPGTPAGVSVDPEGCPADSDGDGVPDVEDACPGTPAGVSVDARGCPRDSDGDGVADASDACPGTPSGVEVDASGCPLDSDQDGVPDFRDECPGTPTQAEVDASGCPLDTDKDGVPDFRDSCPRTPEGAEVNEAGCWIAGVRFPVDSAAIQPEYRDNLNEALDLLRNAPEMRLKIEGHTDSTGSAVYNRELSERRARAVRDYFVEQGVNPERLSVEGYGESRPIASNESREGRAQNRRVQLQPMD